jgi:hypothetical protein
MRPPRWRSGGGGPGAASPEILIKRERERALETQGSGRGETGAGVEPGATAVRRPDEGLGLGMKQWQESEQMQQWREMENWQKQMQEWARLAPAGRGRPFAGGCQAGPAPRCRRCLRCQCPRTQSAPSKDFEMDMGDLDMMCRCRDRGASHQVPGSTAVPPVPPEIRQRRRVWRRCIIGFGPIRGQVLDVESRGIDHGPQRG